MTHSRCTGFLVVLAALGSWSGVHPAGAVAPAGVTDAVCRQLAGGGEADWLESGLVHAFYAARNCGPAWIGADGDWPLAAELMTILHAAESEGLQPLDYHLLALEARLRLVAVTHGRLSPARIARLDLQLTDAALAYGLHLSRGRVDPRSIEEAASRPVNDVDIVHALDAAIASGSIRAAWSDLAPPQPSYARLRSALAAYRRISARGGWLAIREAKGLRAGDRGPAVAALRARLRVTDDLHAAPLGVDDVFDAVTASAVRDFERRHGFAADGAVEDQTLAALNTPVERRIAQIEVNLERQRWLPRGPEIQRTVVVNSAAFDLSVLEDGKVALKMRAIVGKPSACTPEIDDEIEYLVFNPAWEVPEHLAGLELLPLIQRDPQYLERQGIKVLSGWGPDAKEIDPAAIDWARMTPETLHLRLRQAAGPLNPLGRLKFVFPNHFDVYLHDTPAPESFGRTVRAFSHGCVRIERPIELAEYLLRGNGGWSRERIVSAVAADSERTVTLPEKVPVHLVYWTAWVDEDGTVQFRDDIYGRDPLVRAALDRPVAPSRRLG